MRCSVSTSLFCALTSLFFLPAQASVKEEAIESLAKRDITNEAVYSEFFSEVSKDSGRTVVDQVEGFIRDLEKVEAHISQKGNVSATEERRDWGEYFEDELEDELTREELRSTAASDVSSDFESVFEELTAVSRKKLLKEADMVKATLENTDKNTDKKLRKKMKRKKEKPSKREQPTKNESAKKKNDSLLKAFRA